MRLTRCGSRSLAARARAWGAVADRRRPRAGWLLRDDGRLPADHGGRAVDRRSARSAVAPEPRDGREAIRTLSAAIRRNVSRCWASLFTERAVTYRLRNGFGHRKARMAVAVQQMLFPQAAGVLFTAGPVTSSRRVAFVDASFGLGEALVSGLVNADVFKVRDGEVVAKAVAATQRAVHASPAGGTQEQPIDLQRQEPPALADAQAVRPARPGRRIEAHFGRPQDIEWCLADDGFQIVQSRPITTLFPIPESGDRENHVYVSVGHQQMMTDPMKPLGLSFWQMTTPAPMAEAGGRLFVDVTQRLASPASRAGLLEALGRSDPLTGDALQTMSRETATRVAMAGSRL